MYAPDMYDNICLDRPPVYDKDIVLVMPAEKAAIPTPRKLSAVPRAASHLPPPQVRLLPKGATYFGSGRRANDLRSVAAYQLRIDGQPWRIIGAAGAAELLIRAAANAASETSLSALQADNAEALRRMQRLAAADHARVIAAFDEAEDRILLAGFEAAWAAEK